MNDTVEFAMNLIRQPSVTPDDAGCQRMIAERLLAAGFAVESLVFGEVTNLWARRGDAAPLFCFAGHTDVVPPGAIDEWHSDPFAPEIRDGMLYGRGAADMKASLAAMVDAAVDFVAAHPEHAGSISFLITSDEEGRARDGTRRVVETLSGRGETIDMCVIGEPSSTKHLGDAVKVGRRGSLSCELTVNGQQGHVAYPHLARNPIANFAPALAELYSQRLDDGNEFFPPSSFQVVRIHSDGGAVNVTPEALTARFNIRYSTEWTWQKLKTHIEEIFRRHNVDCQLDWHLSGEPFFTPPGPLVSATAAAIRKTTGLDPELSTAGGTSDGRFIAPAGAAVVEFGPANATIHKINEHIPVADIDVMRQTYGEILRAILAP